MTLKDPRVDDDTKWEHRAARGAGGAAELDAVAEIDAEAGEEIQDEAETIAEAEVGAGIDAAAEVDAEAAVRSVVRVSHPESGYRSEEEKIRTLGLCGSGW